MTAPSAAGRTTRGTLSTPVVLILGFVFIDLLGYSLILPLLPYYVTTFGASYATAGLLSTANALAQFIATPFIGRLSDRYGRRPLLIFCIAGTFLSFLLLAFARSVPMLLLSRVTDGLFGGNIALARAYITDVTDEKNRARGLGLIGAVFGLGFIIGPAMGGFLSRWGYALPAFVAAGLSLLNLIAVILWLPESLPEVRRAEMRERERPPITLGAMLQALRRPCSGPLLHVQLFYALTFTLFQSNFALFALAKLRFNAQTTSYVLTYVGMLVVLVQGVAIGFIVARVRERRLIFLGSAVLGVSLILWAFSPSLVWLLLVLAPLALASGVLNTIITSQLTKVVARNETGGILGLGASFQSLAQIIAPGLGGLLIQGIGPWSVGILAGILMLWTAAFVYRHILSQPEGMDRGVTCTAPAA
jgi:DHA1 family tetracycline resistance protein-like MFS transporter